MAEKEYIEREAAIANRREYNLGGSYDNTELAVPVDAINSIPAADVRPVVLCRDCVNYVESDEANGEKMCVIDAEWCEEDGCYYGFNSYTEPDWFCAGGKKREES